MVVGHQKLDVDLPLLAPRPDVSGSYTLTLAAAEECGIGLGEAKCRRRPGSDDTALS